MCSLPPSCPVTARHRKVARSHESPLKLVRSSVADTAWVAMPEGRAERPGIRPCWSARAWMIAAQKAAAFHARRPSESFDDARVELHPRGRRTATGKNRRLRVCADVATTKSAGRNLREPTRFRRPSNVGPVRFQRRVWRMSIARHAPGRSAGRSGSRVREDDLREMSCVPRGIVRLRSTTRASRPARESSSSEIYAHRCKFASGHIVCTGVRQPQGHFGWHYGKTARRCGETRQRLTSSRPATATASAGHAPCADWPGLAFRRHRRQVQ